MAAIELNIDDLLLDTENPRIGSASNQRDALQKVLDDQGDKLHVLAESIVQEGMNPLKRLLVMREKKQSKRYISLEGNRRVAALKILSNPAILTSLSLKTALQKRLEVAASEFNPESIEPIACFAVDDRESANSWIMLEHTGENEGRGVVGWSGLAASRFRGNDPALQALDFVQKYGDLSADDSHKLTTEFPITTLDRLLSSKEVRSKIGVDVKDRKLVSALPAEELLKPLRKMVLDLLHREKNVSDLKNKSQQISYLDSWDVVDKPDLSRAAKNKVRAVAAVASGEFKTKVSTTKKKKVDLSQRKSVVPRSLALNVTDARIGAILKELRTLRVDEAPNAIAVLLRVFLELSVDSYLARHGISIRFKDTKSGRTIDKALKAKVDEAVNKIVETTDCHRKDFFGMSRSISDTKSPLSIELLHGYVHNRFVIPKPKELIGAWDEAQYFFENIWP
ncbi:MAG: hypothetical protein Q7T44_07070 [Parvibaculum sp.]|nr:hypothetical protein [Parvibaculum sp.]